MKKPNTLVNLSSEAELSDKTIMTASSKAKDLLDRTFEKLKDAARRETTEPKPDKLFPNGIELIYIKIEAGVTERIKVGVEIKIAGAKGIGKALTFPEVVTNQVAPEGE